MDVCYFSPFAGQRATAQLHYCSCERLAARSQEQLLTERALQAGLQPGHQNNLSQDSLQPAASGSDDVGAPLSDSAVKVAVVVRAQSSDSVARSPALSCQALACCQQVRPLLENEETKKAKTCCHVQNDQTVVLSPRGSGPGPTGPDAERLAFQMERAYLLNSLLAERRLFGELINPLLDRFLAGFNATVSHPRACSAAT